MNTNLLSRSAFVKTVFVLCWLTSMNSHAQAVITESFDNTTFLPVGWNSVGSSTLWSRRTSGTFPTCTPQSGIGMARFSSRAQVAGTAQTIVTPLIDYSIRASSTAYISFSIYRDNGSVNGDSIALYINTASSYSGAELFGTVARYSKMSVPDTVAANGWYKYTFNVPSKYTSGTNYILIKGISQNGNNIYMDDVQWNTFPNLCSGKPTPGTAVPSPALLCGGTGSSTITLNGQTSGVSGLAYQWSNAPSANGPWIKVGISTPTLNTGNITFTQYYKCVISCMNSGLSDSTPVMAVVVKPGPSPTITISPFSANYCAGSALGTKIFAKGASTYSWSPVTGLNVSNSDTVYAAPTVTTTYTVKGTDTAGCSGSTFVTVTLRQPPIVVINAVDTLICENDSVQLLAQTGGGGNTYLWSPTGKTQAGIFVHPLVNTKYNVTVTNTFGCKGTAGKNVLVNLKPKAKFAVIITGRTYSFTDSSANAANVSWDFGDGNSSTNKNPTYTFSFDGTKTIAMVAHNPPCAADTFKMTFNVSAIHNTSIQRKFELYPNPASQLVNITFYDRLEKGTIRITDMAGKLIREIKLNGEGSIIFDVRDLSKGLYLINLNNSIEKLMVE